MNAYASASGKSSPPVKDMPESERPLSEQYRLVAKTYVDLNAAANLLEETKSAVLSQMMAKLGDIPVSRAELHVKASPEWTEFVTKMVTARREADLKKLQLEYLRMRFAEWNDANANARAEMKMGRAGP